MVWGIHTLSRDGKVKDTVPGLTALDRGERMPGMFYVDGTYIKGMEESRKSDLTPKQLLTGLVSGNSLSALCRRYSIIAQIRILSNYESDKTHELQLAALFHFFGGQASSNAKHPELSY